MIEGREEMQVTTRPFNPKTDAGFIYCTMPKSVYFSSTNPIQGDKREWFGHFYNYLNELLALATINVACFADNPDCILGYSIVSGDSLHFVYVKEAFRNQRIASLLLKANPYQTIHQDNLTKVGKAILSRKNNE